MKKSLAVLTVATLLVVANGCGSCRGLFGKSAAPVATTVYSPCAPTCAPSCSTGPSCGCASGTPVTYGFGNASEVQLAPGTTFESTPMSIPAGSGTFGQ